MARSRVGKLGKSRFIHLSQLRYALRASEEQIQEAIKLEAGTTNAHGSQPELSIGNIYQKRLIRQSEGVHRTAARTHDVLLPIYSVTDRAARIGAAQIRVPQGLAGLRIEGDESPVHATPEY